ncbi:MAG: hypothetical protein AAF642_03445 [Pseudomonadota bacterium]
MLSASVLINLISAAGLLVLLASIRRSATPDAIQSRLVWLIGMTTGLFVARSISWTTGLDVFVRAEIIFAAPLPLLLVIVTEAVLRRHAPIAMKVFVTGAAIVFALTGLIGHRGLEPWFSYALASVQLATLIFCVSWLMARDQEARSAAENRTATIFMVILALAGMLFFTDYTSISNAPARLGALGFLMAAYVMVGSLAPNFSARKLAIEAAIVVGVTASIAALAINVLGWDDFGALVGLSSILFALFLTAIIIFRYFGMRLQTEDELIRALEMARTQSITTFLEDALSTEFMRDATLVSEPELSEYDIATIKSCLATIPVFETAKFSSERDDRAIEQILDLLRRHDASHAVMVSATPLQIVLSPVPSFGDAGSIRSFMAMMGKIARLIDPEPASGAPT